LPPQGTGTLTVRWIPETAGRIRQTLNVRLGAGRTIPIVVEGQAQLATGKAKRLPGKLPMGRSRLPLRTISANTAQAYVSTNMHVQQPGGVCDKDRTGTCGVQDDLENQSRLSRIRLLSNHGCTPESEVIQALKGLESLPHSQEVPAMVKEGLLPALMSCLSASSMSVKRAAVRAFARLSREADFSNALVKHLTSCQGGLERIANAFDGEEDPYDTTNYVEDIQGIADMFLNLATRPECRGPLCEARGFVHAVNLICRLVRLCSHEVQANNHLAFLRPEGEGAHMRITQVQRSLARSLYLLSSSSGECHRLASCSLETQRELWLLAVERDTLLDRMAQREVAKAVLCCVLAADCEHNPHNTSPSSLESLHLAPT